MRSLGIALLLLAVAPAVAQAQVNCQLREVEGQSTEEICEELGISESNCWVMLYRARMSLRESLEKRWFLREENRAPEQTDSSPRRSKSGSAAAPEML